MSVLRKNSLLASQLTLCCPDDWHLHVRDGEALQFVVPDSARQFARAIIMPNLKPPVTTVLQAEAYRERIIAAVPDKVDFDPLMTLYLTEETSPAEIEKAAVANHVYAVKYYPAGATTNSAAGVRDLKSVCRVLSAMAEVGLPLLVHGEVVDSTVDIFDREALFIEQQLKWLCDTFPQLKVVFEHITTSDAVDFVSQGDSNLAATVTAHHLLMNRNALFVGGIRPHNYCLPVAKRESHRLALLAAVTSGDKHFFLGTDSAPHARSAKETECGCAGIYTSRCAVELYAEAFAQSDSLDQLESFASFNGPDFYGLPRNTSKAKLRACRWTMEQSLPYVGDVLVPFRAGEVVEWCFDRKDSAVD